MAPPPPHRQRIHREKVLRTRAVALEGAPHRGQDARPMNRPARKLKNVEEKVAKKVSLGKKRLGKKTKQWKRDVLAYKPLVEGATSEG
jgi:hypothetical protein